MDKLHECVKYFKSQKGYKRLFEGIKEKYRSLGTLGGKVELRNLIPDEQEALSGLLKKDYYSKKSASIKIENIIKSLEDTKFSGVDFEKVLFEYFGEELISKKEEKRIYKREKEDFFNEILVQIKGTRAHSWLENTLMAKSSAYKIIMQKYDKNKEELRLDLMLLCSALNELSFDENKIERLAIFSSRISKNPHTFDLDTDLGKLLLYGISYVLTLDFPKNAEERSETLYRAGIIDDEVSNFTMISNFLGLKDNKIHPGWEGFYKSGEPLQISLWNLSRVDEIRANGKKAFIFENPTVFSEVLINTASERPSLICTYGQIRLASFIFLDKLFKNIDEIYYSGDFDPEGLLIADRLIERYGEKLKLWHFEIEDYLKIASTKLIDEVRLKKLNKLKNPKLNKLGNIIRERGVAAYQELLIEDYITDIRDGSFGY